MSFFKSIRFRLTIWYLLVIMVLLACFGVAAYVMLSYQLHQSLDESIRTEALQFEVGLKTDESGNITSAGQPNDLVLVYDDNGMILLKLGPDISFIEVDNLVQLALMGQSSFLTERVQGQEVRFYATPFSLSTNMRLAVVIGTPPTTINQTLGTVRSVFLLSAFLAVILAALGSSTLANRMLYPLRKMIGVAEDIGETNLNQRIEVHNEDEVGKLASTLNRMMERLEVAFNRQRQFAADASHELRTPLSVIQAETTLALGKKRTAEEYEKSLEVVSQEVDYITNMLGNLLSMARSESGKEPLNFQNINIKDVLNDLSPNVAVLARDKGQQIKISLAENLPVEGDRVKLKQLFMNIFENAVRYTPAGGTIAVSAISSKGLAVVSISDNGIGIPSDQLPLIFERFYRVDKARSRSEGGAGLGLPIAKQIAEVHGGRIEVESEVGKGSTFRVFIPLIGGDQNGKEIEHP